MSYTRLYCRNCEGHGTIGPYEDCPSCDGMGSRLEWRADSHSKITENPPSMIEFGKSVKNCADAYKDWPNNPPAQAPTAQPCVWVEFEGWAGLRMLLHAVTRLVFAGRVTVIVPRDSAVKHVEDYGVQ